MILTLDICEEIKSKVKQAVNNYIKYDTQIWQKVTAAVLHTFHQKYFVIKQAIKQDFEENFKIINANKIEIIDQAIRQFAR